jgi:threonine dehydrogenase-like Zn-dependent dehydrogenase
MPAVICHGPGDYTLEEVPVPVPGPGEMLIRVEAVGICASDLKCYHGAAKFWGDENRPAWAETDVIPGHEITGAITELDQAAAERWQVGLGDRIVIEQIAPCGTCYYCMRGLYQLCAAGDIFGFKRAYGGGMASFMRVPVNALVHKISSQIPPAHAAFAEPLSCGLHAVERAELRFADVVVIAGAGPIGLSMLAGTKAKYAGQIIVLDLDTRKLAIAKQMGADVTIDISKQEPVAAVMDLTGGIGADVYLEGTGHPQAVAQGLNLLRKRGRFVEYSVFKENVTVDWTIISDDKELDVIGAHLGPWCWPAAIKLIESGALPLDQICTHQLPLSQFEKGLDLVARGDESIKVSLLP